jgi:iron(III) transport system substrate-binding protein
VPDGFAPKTHSLSRKIMNQKHNRRFRSVLWTLLTAGFALSGCNSTPPGVVLYTDRDPAAVDAVKQQIEAEVKVRITEVRATPEEARSGVGLSQRIREERGDLKTDVYWADNQLAMQKLVEDRLLEKHKSALNEKFSPEFRDKEFFWTGVDARVRVLLINKKAVPRGRLPKSLADLARPEWKGRGAIADPRHNGSARYHFIVLFDVVGTDDAKELLTRMKANGVQFLADETAVVEAVASGKAAWGVTDSDLAETAVQAGKPVDYIVPDQEYHSTAKAMGKSTESVHDLGTPLLLSCVGLLRERPSRGEGERLFEALIKAGTMTTLARVAPNRLPTHPVLLENPPSQRKNKIKLPLDLEIATPAPDKINAAQTQLTLALSEILGK